MTRSVPRQIAARGLAIEALKLVRQLRSSFAFVSEPSHQQRERLDVPGGLERASIHRIEAHVPDELEGHCLGIVVIAALKHAGPRSTVSRLEHPEEHLARYAA